MFRSELAPHSFNNTCLTFLILDGVRPENRRDEWLSREVAQAYCLETGTLTWPGLPKRPPVSLRDRGPLAEWEPMNVGKFEAIAADSGVVGQERSLPGRIAWPSTSALVVSPEGFLMCWEESFIRTSDIVRLGGAHQPLANRRDGWNEYYHAQGNEDDDPMYGPGFRGLPVARGWVGNERTPHPLGIHDLNVATLSGCNRMAIAPIDESGNDAYGQYTPETIEFIRHHLGIDPGTVDWDTAGSHRLINAQFANTAAFTPAPARAALQHALAPKPSTRPANTRTAGTKAVHSQVTRRLLR
ncbi:hypothetical protein [Amycolatopsis sp. CA-126428]|uniref:hypothetical protein n=1 Tax=Amycolatopsis sp. CA-126428 TaxID=2073158 RepID=UPI0011B04258|nr:hypothetical protein [Amycolatopsis sp. CA-126428]